MIFEQEKLLHILRKMASEGTAEFKERFPLSTACTFKTGGNAKFAFFPKTVNALSEIAVFCKENGIYYSVFGNGSNVIFSDKGFNGVVIFTTLLCQYKIDGNKFIAECGASLTHLASVAQKSGLGGMEFAYGIPGTLGGAVYMNAGAFGGEMKGIVTSVNWYDTEKNIFGSYIGDENRFDYRESVYQRENKIILSAEMELIPRDKEIIRAEMTEYMQKRRDNQPLEYPSAGSTFKRYPGYFTGKLIQDAGLKGYSVGGAQVSEKHAGFVINKGNATSEDILSLISDVKAKIFAEFGLNIECEVRVIPDSAE